MYQSSSSRRFSIQLASTVLSRRSSLLLAGILALCVCSPSTADTDAPLVVQTEKREIVVTKLVSGLNHPWSIAFISETDWLVTERNGQLRRVVNNQLQANPITGLPDIKPAGQGGILDVALHPEFEKNQLVYVSYSNATSRRYNTEVLRGKLVDNNLENVEVIFQALPKAKGGRHFGSRLAFDNEGMLYISLGDRGNKKVAQDLGSHSGSIIRLNDDGSVPDSNPFLNVEGALTEIYSYGHRNVQGMTFDKNKNTLWAHEHGPQGGDELNNIVAGTNYGWPVITYGVNYGLGTKIGEGTEKDGMAQPATYWDPSIAPSGLASVNSPKFPEWQGNLLVGALKFQQIVRLELANGKVTHEERFLSGELGRIRDIRQGPDAALYLLTDSGDGAIYRVE